MSFNVFDEAPENRLVIKEQQMFANKVGSLCAKLTLVAHCIFLMIMLSFLEETFVFMALKEDLD